MKHTYQVKGMHCASCATLLGAELKKLPGVSSVNVNYATQNAVIDHDEATHLDKMNQTASELGYEILPPKNETHSSGHQHDSISNDSEIAQLKNKVEFSLPLALLVFFLMLWESGAKYFPWMPNLPLDMGFMADFLAIIASVILVTLGKAYWEGLWRFLRLGKANMDSLIGLGVLSAYLFSILIYLFPKIAQIWNLPTHNYFDVVIVVLSFVVFGKYLETLAKQKTGQALESLLSLQANTAHVKKNGKVTKVSIESIEIGDIIVVHPDEKIALDGVVVAGESFVDQSMITGESIPVAKSSPDRVYGGTLNGSGFLEFRVEKIGSETMLAKIITLVQDAQNSKAPIEALADKISAKFVPTVLVIAVFSMILWLSLGTHFLGFNTAFGLALQSFVGVLVIACPCALGLATPTAMIVGMGMGARNGVLVRDASALEALGKIDTVVFDKTGTLTSGKPEVMQVILANGQTKTQLEGPLSLAAKSLHPLSRAIVSYADRSNIKESKVTDFVSHHGLGVEGVVHGKKYYLGSRQFLLSNGIKFTSEEDLSGSKVYFASKDQYLGTFQIVDSTKFEAKSAVDYLTTQNIDVIMLTGDNEKTASNLSKELGIAHYKAQVLPNEKLAEIQKLQEKGKIVAMLGDGVNDGPALAKANVGIAMSTGTDLAIDIASITLLHGNLDSLERAHKIAKTTMQTVKQNLFFAFIYNLIGIPLAAGIFYPFFGYTLSPVFAGFAMAMSSVSVVANALRIKGKKV